MPAAPIPADEDRRLARLRELLVLDSEPEPIFDDIAALASEVCGVPIALLSLVDAERQWFKANVGLPGVHQTPRELAFCAHAVASSDALFEVADARIDPRFATNPLVTGAPEIRFYAGAPLVLPGGGERIGTLCVIDRQARRLDAPQAALLQRLAALASRTLVMRRELIDRSLAVRTQYEQALATSEARYRAIVEEQAELVSLARADGTLVYVNPSYARHFGLEPEALIGHSLFDHVEPADRAVVAAQIAEVLRGGESRSGENRMQAGDGSERWVAWTNRLQRDLDGQPLLHSVGRDISERKRMERALQDSQALLLRTGRVAGVGGWQLDLQDNQLVWSDETRRIHEVTEDFVPTLDNAIAFYAPEARGAIEGAVQTALAGGQSWDLELPLLTARGRRIWVRAQGEAEFEGGQPVRLVGAFQDISERKFLQQSLADNERFLRLVTDSLPIRIAYIDRELRYRFVNQPHCRRFGRRREDIIGRTRAELLPPAATTTEVNTRLAAALGGAAQRFEFDDRVGGELRRIESLLIPDIAESGEVRGLFTTGTDITERSAAEHAMRELTAQLTRQGATLRAVIEAIPAVVAVVGADQRYRFVNSAFERWMGAPRDRVVDHTLQEVLGQQDYERSRPFIERALAGESVQFERDYPGRTAVRHLTVSYIPLWLEGGGVDGFVGVAQDVTLHKQEEIRLLQLSHRDALTGLLNRAGFEQAMAQHVAAGDGKNLALLYIDLDHFKPVNDQFGHPVGDQVLQQFGQRLRQLVRPTDAVARLGGDEFALLLVGVREGANAHAVANKVLAAAHEPFQVGPHRLRIGASIGVAFDAGSSGDWHDLVVRADALLYRAKAEGRGRQAGAADPA